MEIYLDKERSNKDNFIMITCMMCDFIGYKQVSGYYWPWENPTPLTSLFRNAQEEWFRYYMHFVARKYD